ncbi:hypothetical protein Q7P37_000009 [Cladosporium fusiforme]
MEEYTQARSRAAQNAILLACLNEIPIPPAKLRWPPMLADDFAFISSMKYDPNRVTAVCLEANQYGEGIVFRIASNTGNPTHVAEELQAIADIMMQASKYNISRDEASQRLFEKITEICFSRILTRLRSKHAARSSRTKNKPAMVSLLMGAVSHCMHQTSSGILADGICMERVKEQCDELSTVFEELEECDPEERPHQVRVLRELLSLAHRFDVQSLPTILTHSTASVREYLLRAVEKLGRYRAIAAGLANASRTKEHSLFQHIIVQPIATPELDPNDLKSNGSLQDFESVWSRTTNKTSLHGVYQLREQAGKKYQRRLCCDRRWKIHAEVQILLYYEQRPYQRLPRVICASKSACYLCHLFFEVHGRFIVPRTHSKIYDRWTLPRYTTLDSKNNRNLLSVMHRFNQALETMIQKALTGPVCQLPPPNESVVALYEPWSSHSTVKQQQIERYENVVRKMISSTADEADAPRPFGYCPSKDSQTHPSSSTISLSIKSEHAQRTWLLEQGEQICRDFEQGNCISIETPAIKLQCSWPTDHTGDATKAAIVAYFYRVCVEYMQKESETIADTHVLDVNRMQYDRSQVVGLDSASGMGRVVCRNGQHRDVSNMARSGFFTDKCGQYRQPPDHFALRL